MRKHTAKKGLFAGGIVQFRFFPDIPSDFMQANIELEPGSSIAQRDMAMEQLLLAMKRMDEKVIEEYGSGVIRHSVAFDQGRTAGGAFIELTKGETREIDTDEIAERWRSELPELPGVRTIDIGAGGGPGGGPDISIQFSSENLAQLKAATDELKLHLAGYDGVADINDSFSGGSDEIRLNIKPQAEVLGLSLDMLASQVRYGFYGAEAQRIQRGDEEVKVMVRYPKAERSSIGNLENMRIRTPAGDEIPFSEVADIELAEGYGSIIRVDGERSITVTAKADKNKVDPNEVAGSVLETFIPEMLTRYPDVHVKLEGQSKEQAEAGLGLLKGFGFALFAIYALLAIPLKSYSQPLIIMSVIPFGMVGAIFGHLLMGHPVSVLSICGIIALTGVVVNDSLILVDFVNRARKEGLRLIDAVIQSGAERFRPIILTSLTTFMGLVPIVLFEKSLQAQIVIPMAISLAYGILFATVITLLLVPALYLILNDMKDMFKSKNKRLAEQA